MSKLFFFFPYFISDGFVCFFATELWICAFIFLHNDNGSTHEHAVLCIFVRRAELRSMLCRAPDKAAQDVASLGVRRAHAISDHKSGGADVVGNNTERTKVAAIVVCFSREMRKESDDVLKSISRKHIGIPD